MTPSFSPNRRRGISLLEVMISIGILSIGLLSVLSLLPAGRTYLVKAEIDDRAAAIIPNSLSTMEALGLFTKDSLEWDLVTAAAVNDGEVPAERPIFRPNDVLVLHPDEQAINKDRWKNIVINTAAIKDWHPPDPNPLSISGTTPEPDQNVRITRTSDQSPPQTDVFTQISGTNRRWSDSVSMDLDPAPDMQINESGPNPSGVKTSPNHWIDYTFKVEYEEKDPKDPLSIPAWTEIPFTIKPDPSRMATGNLQPTYRHYGRRRWRDQGTGTVTIDLAVSPIDRSNETADAAQPIAPPALLDIVKFNKIRMIRRADLPYSGELWRFKTGRITGPFTRDSEYANSEAQTLLATPNDTYPSPFWSNPGYDPPGDWPKKVYPPTGSDIDNFTVEQDVDWISFPVSAGDGFSLDWQASNNNAVYLADPTNSSSVAPPFPVEFRQTGGGNWVPLAPFYRGSQVNQYTVPNDGQVRTGVALAPFGHPTEVRVAATDEPNGPINTVTYDSGNPKNKDYQLNVSVFRPDRMVAIDPLMCAHLDRVINKGAPGNERTHPLATRRLRFAAFEQWFAGNPNDPRAFVIPRLNWRKIAEIPDFDAAIAVAERICRVEDAVVANQPVDEDAANEPGFDVSSDGAPLRRQASGRMTWMLTVQPENLGSVEANWNPGSYFTASVVVFQDRRFPQVGDTTLEGEYAFEGDWSNADGLIRVYVPVNDPITKEPLAMEDEDLKRLLGAGSWMLLGPRVTNTTTPVDSRMRLEWVKIQTSQIEKRQDQIVVTILPEKQPGENILLAEAARNPDGSPYAVAGDPRFRIMVLAYQGVVAVIQRSIPVRP
jgi:hypothetical protein